MSRLSSASLTERPDAIDHCLAGISRLSSEVKDASSYIPAYDQRTYGEAIKALQEKLQNVRTELGAGPKKFKFTTKKNRSAISIGEAAEMAQNRRLLGPRGGAWDSSAGSSAMNSAFSPTPLDKLSPGEEKRELEALEGEKNGLEAVGVKVEDRVGERVVLPASGAQVGSYGVVSNVRGSVIDLSAHTANGGSFATLMLKNIRESVVVTGRVTGPIHVTGLENSVIVTSCRQFRMHGAKKVDVYLHCSSRPIIEDCENVRFAPLPPDYVSCIPSLHNILAYIQQMSEDLASSANQWDQIDDFKWLKAEASPHWTILPEPDRVQKDLTGYDNEGPDDILRAFGVSTSS